MHTPRGGKENAAIGRDRGMMPQHPIEARKVRRIGMRTLNDLWQLAWVAYKHDVPRGTPHGGHVCQSNLARLVHKKPIKGLHILVTRKEPCGAAHDMGLGERSVVV